MPASSPDPAGAGGRVLVVGSLNMDLVMGVPRFPEPGETLHGHGFSAGPGGKGANQAVACARLGGRVAMVGRVGADPYGEALCAALAGSGVDVARVRRTAGAPTGVAMILVEAGGGNRIALDAGANGTLAESDLDGLAGLLPGAALLVAQLEVPLPVVAQALALARRAGVRTLLNPAPAQVLSRDLLERVDLLVPNQGEAARLCGFPVPDRSAAFAAGHRLRRLGAGTVLVTLGADGVAVVDAAGERHHPAHPAVAVDTTAAGDCFIGGLAAALAEGQGLDAAVGLGQRAAAVCVARAGAQPSLPWRSDL